MKLIQIPFFKLTKLCFNQACFCHLLYWKILSSPEKSVYPYRWPRSNSYFSLPIYSAINVSGCSSRINSYLALCQMPFWNSNTWIPLNLCIELSSQRLQCLGTWPTPKLMHNTVASVCPDFSPKLIPFQWRELLEGWANPFIFPFFARGALSWLPVAYFYPFLH